jgi:tryptophanyl-tRNA synthetase
VTDSRAPGEPKEVEGSALFQIYQAFATAEETAAMRQAYADGISWGDAKQKLFERIDREIAPMRERYEDLMAHPERWKPLQAGAERPAPWPPAAAAPARRRGPAHADWHDSQPRRPRPTRPHCRCSSNTARKTASSTSSSPPPRPGAAAKHRLCPAPRGRPAHRPPAAEGAAALEAVRSHLQPLDGVQEADITAALQQLHAAAQAE